MNAGNCNKELKGPAGVEQLRALLRGRGLALVVSRNMTRRADRQQDVGLKIAGSATQTADPGVTPIEVSFLQFVQADLLRGYDNFIKGRRPIAQSMHDGLNPILVNAPVGSVQLGPDGSMAAFVPASRALSWQLTTTTGDPVVRERYWLTFAPGEIRVCANCHGVNRTDVVLNQPAPTNPPQALRNLIRWYRATYTTEPPPLSGPAPRITRVAVFRFPFRVMITGQNFRPGAQVFLNADTKPWANTLRNNELLLTLGGEQALMKKLLVGTPTRIRVVTPDGKSASATFTRRS
jgi:hypothetical protein